MTGQRQGCFLGSRLFDVMRIDQDRYDRQINHEADCDDDEDPGELLLLLSRHTYPSLLWPLLPLFALHNFFHINKFEAISASGEVT